VRRDETKIKQAKTTVKEIIVFIAVHTNPCSKKCKFVAPRSALRQTVNGVDGDRLRLFRFIVSYFIAQVRAP